MTERSVLANDLKAALGRQSKQEEARKEVENRKAELDASEARINESEEMSKMDSEFVKKNAQTR